MLLEALTFYAVVEYTKCFNSDLGDKLDLGICEDNLPINPGPADLSAREFHTLIMKYRNEHLVHSDRLLKVADTGGMKFSTGDYAVGSVVATRSYREGVSFYGSLNSLTTTALQEAIKRREAGQQRLMAALKTGEAIVSDETIQLMPISDELTPREMSGLPPRS